MIPKKLRDWLFKNRTTVRLAFVLRLFSMAASSMASLVWMRLLLRAMGDGPLGLFLSFQPIATLGGLGDLGITGALGIRTGQAVARGEEDKLKEFLAAGRGLLLLFAVALCGTFLVLSPWLPGWLGFRPDARAGSLTLLFAMGAPAILAFLCVGYTNALNGGYGTVTWPIIPLLLIAQLGLAMQWVFACMKEPLWIQFFAVTAALAMQAFFGLWMLRIAHPWLWRLRPILFDSKQWKDLAKTSIWAYLYNLGFAIYTTTARLLINAGFEASLVPRYLFNAKLCDLSLQIIGTACAVSLPKINQWLASPDPAIRETAKVEIQRLNLFQTLLAGTASIFYITLNDAFMQLWLGKAHLAPLSWQIAFALNLAVTASGNVSVQVGAVCGASGLRFTGVTIGLTGLLNFGLAFFSMKSGSILGIALAAVFAQSVLVLILGWQVCNFLKIDFRAWACKSWLLPLAVTGAACGMRAWVPLSGPLNIVLLLTADLLLIWLLAVAIGFRLDLLKHELRTIQGIFGRR